MFQPWLKETQYTKHVSICTYTHKRNGPEDREPETRTELSHQISSQESRAPENRGDLSGDRTPSGGTMLDGRSLAGVFVGHDFLVASLLRDDCWFKAPGGESQSTVLP